MSYLFGLLRLGRAIVTAGLGAPGEEEDVEEADAVPCPAVALAGPGHTAVAVASTGHTTIALRGPAQTIVSVSSSAHTVVSLAAEC